MPTPPSDARWEQADRILESALDLAPSERPGMIAARCGDDVGLLDDGAGDVTRTHVRAMAPAFASPEQIQGGPITTATDIYQLGMLLSLLLAGTWPYPRGAGSHAAMMLAIRRARPEPGGPSRPARRARGGRRPGPVAGGRRSRRLGSGLDGGGAIVTARRGEVRSGRSAQ